MKCERCNERDASVFLTQVIDDQSKEMHLCEACAADLGINIKQTISVTDVLMGLGQDLPVDLDESTVEVTCRTCGTKRKEYKKRGRLGCPDCYVAFKNDVEAFIRSTQHAEKHVGKSPACHGLHAADHVLMIRKQIQEAVGKEAYEEAARLRDVLSGMTEKPTETA